MAQADQLLLRQLSVNFNDQDRVVLMRSSQQIFIFTFTINPVFELLHPAAIILNLGCLHYFQGPTENEISLNKVPSHSQ